MALADIAREAGIPEPAVNITAEFEGCLKKVKGQDLYAPYLCPARVPTIGLGTTVYNRTGVKVTLKDPPRTRAECEGFLAYDLGKKYAPAVMRSVGKKLQTENQYSACISMAYNVGTGGFSKSTLAWLINNGQHDRAANEFLKWTRGGGRVLPGLVRRRAAERKLFLTPGNPYPMGNNTPAVLTPVQPKPAAPPARSWLDRIFNWRS